MEFFFPIKPQKMPQQIINVIRSLILSNELEEGAKLPNEQMLMQGFKVSRQTIRESLCALEAMGLIKLRPGLGGGAFVTGVDLKMARNALSNFLFNKNFTIHHLTEVRLALEPSAAVHAASSMSADAVNELAEILDKCRKAIEREDDPVELRRLEIEFHASIVRSTGNPIWLLLQDCVEHFLWDVKVQLRTQNDFSFKVLRMHESILEAITRGDAVAASECMREDILWVAQGLSRIAEEQGRLSFQ